MYCPVEDKDKKLAKHYKLITGISEVIKTKLESCRLHIQEITKRKEEITGNALQSKNSGRMGHDFNDKIRTFNAVVHAKREITKIEAWKTKILYLREVVTKDEPLSVDQEKVTQLLDISEGTDVVVEVQALENVMMEWFSDI